MTRPATARGMRAKSRDALAAGTLQVPFGTAAKALLRNETVLPANPRDDGKIKPQLSLGN